MIFKESLAKITKPDIDGENDEDDLQPLIRNILLSSRPDHGTDEDPYQFDPIRPQSIPALATVMYPVMLVSMPDENRHGGRPRHHVMGAPTRDVRYGT